MSVKNELQEFFQKRGLGLPHYTYTRTGGEDHTPAWVCQVELPDKDGSGFKSYLSEVYSSKKKASESAAKLALENIGLCEETFSSYEREEGILVDQINFREREELLTSLPSKDPRAPPLTENDRVSTFVLLDLENVPNGYKDFCQKRELDDAYTIFAFYSKNSSHIYKKVLREIELYQVPVYFYKAHSAHKDAADVRMSLFVGEILGTIRNARPSAFPYSGYFDIPAETNGSIILDSKEDGSVNMKFIIITNDHFGEALGDLIKNYYYNITGEIQVSAEVYHCISEML